MKRTATGLNLAYTGYPLQFDQAEMELIKAQTKSLLEQFLKNKKK